MVWSPISVMAIVEEDASSREEGRSEMTTSEGVVLALAPVWAIGGMTLETGSSILVAAGGHLVGLKVISSALFFTTMEMEMARWEVSKAPSHLLLRHRRVSCFFFSFVYFLSRQRQAFLSMIRQNSLKISIFFFLVINADIGSSFFWSTIFF